MRFPNQKIIRIKKDGELASPFLGISCERLYAASRNISSLPALKLYLFLCSNADGKEVLSSPVWCETNMGVSRKSYYRAIDELVSLGYLEKLDNGDYIFYEVSQLD